MDLARVILDLLFAPAIIYNAGAASAHSATDAPPAALLAYVDDNW